MSARGRDWPSIPLRWFSVDGRLHLLARIELGQGDRMHNMYEYLARVRPDYRYSIISTSANTRLLGIES
jgi:hypothetical protein